MNFYTGAEANYSSTTHQNAIFLTTDSHKIFFNGNAYGGGEEIDLTQYAKKTDLDGYLPLTGGVIQNKVNGAVLTIITDDDTGSFPGLEVSLDSRLSLPYSGIRPKGFYIEGISDIVELEESGLKIQSKSNGGITTIGHESISVSSGNKSLSLGFDPQQYRITIKPADNEVGDTTIVLDDNDFGRAEYSTGGFKLYKSNLSSSDVALYDDLGVIIANNMSSTNDDFVPSDYGFYFGSDKKVGLTPNGVTTMEKDDSKLLHSNGGTVPISDIISQVYVPTKVSDLTNDSGFQTESQVSAKISALVDSAPSTLDTLNELAAALGDDPNFATTIANQLGNKVDKVTGKELSDNNYTDSDKNKLAGIQSGATAVSFNRSLTSGTQIGTITINGSQTVIYAPTAGESVTYEPATPTTNGLMSANDKKVWDSFIEAMGSYPPGFFIPAESGLATDYEWNSVDNCMSTDATHVDGVIYNGEVFIASSNNVVNSTNIPVATPTTGGVMSPSDKAKLDGINLSLYLTKTDASNTYQPKGNYLTSVSWSQIDSKPSWIGSSKPTYTWSEIGSKPTFATVATSGSYDDLTDKPTIPSAYSLPTASSSTKGGIKVGSGLSISGETLSVNFSGYATQSWVNSQGFAKTSQIPNTDNLVTSIDDITFVKSGSTVDGWPVLNLKIPYTKSNGTQSNVSASCTIVMQDATSLVRGFMSATDKANLDSIKSKVDALDSEYLPITGGILTYTGIPGSLSMEKGGTKLSWSLSEIDGYLFKVGQGTSGSNFIIFDGTYTNLSGYLWGEEGTTGGIMMAPLVYNTPSDPEGGIYVGAINDQNYVEGENTSYSVINTFGHLPVTQVYDGGVRIGFPSVTSTRPNPLHSGRVNAEYSFNGIRFSTVNSANKSDFGIRVEGGSLNEYWTTSGGQQKLKTINGQEVFSSRGGSIDTANYVWLITSNNSAANYTKISPTSSSMVGYSGPVFLAPSDSTGNQPLTDKGYAIVGNTSTSGDTSIRVSMMGYPQLNVGFGTVNWNRPCIEIAASSGTSDIRLKENIQSVSDTDITNVSNIEIRSFNFKSDESHTKRYGAIAQELEEKGLSNLVYEDSDGYKHIRYDEFNLLKIRMLEKQIEALEKKIEDLTSRL